MQMRFPNGKDKVLTFSYDDGNKEDARLAEIFKKYNLKATFNINSGNVSDSEEVRENPTTNLNWGEFKRYYLDNGHEIAVHCLTHPYIEYCSDLDTMYEVIEDRKNIEGRLGVVCRGMAYPFGCYDDATIQVLDKCGIAYSRTTVSTHEFKLPQNPLALHPTCHHNDPELMNLAKKFAEENNRWDQCTMFYVWGHSYEFPRNNNWYVIEDFCEYMANRDNIWYATNIEIFDYIEAYKRLKVSYDKKVIYNPSVCPVWFSENGIHCVKPGETLIIK